MAKKSTKKPTKASSTKKVKKASKDYEVGKGKPPKTTQFKPGNNANPLGANAHDPVAKALRKITKETLNEVIELALNANTSELNRIYQDPETPALKKILCGVIADACKDKTLSSLERLLERLIGKVPTDVTSGGKPLQGGAPAVMIIPANGKTKAENE